MSDTYHRYKVKGDQTGRATKGAGLYDGYADVGDEFVAAEGLAPTEEQREHGGYSRDDYPLWDRLEVVDEDVDAEDLESLDVPFGGALPNDDDEREGARSFDAADVLSRRDRTMKGRGMSEEDAENRDLPDEPEYDSSVPDEGRPYEGDTTDPQEADNGGESGN